MHISSLTTKDVLRYLPIDGFLRDKLLDIYPEKLSFEQKETLEDLVWRVFYVYFDMVYDVIVRQETLDNPGPIPADYHDTLLKKTEEAVLKNFEVDVTNVKLEELRRQLQSLAP